MYVLEPQVHRFPKPLSAENLTHDVADFCETYRTQPGKWDHRVVSTLGDCDALSRGTTAESRLRPHVDQPPAFANDFPYS